MNAPCGPVLSVAQMVAAERAAMDAGVSEWELMQRAGEGAANWIWRMAGGRSVTVACGPGNNGGDGYVIAETLRNQGLEVQVVAPKPAGTQTAQKAAERYQGHTQASAKGVSGDIFIDCLFGYGLSRGLEGEFADCLSSLARSHPVRIAIDVPSGVESDTGAMLSEVPDYQLTLALGAWKYAHAVMPARARMGALRLVDIALILSDHDAAFAPSPQLSAPKPEAHKYRRGLLGVVGGAMPGAALLACEAAMRAGAGYVKLLSDHSHPAAPASLVVEEAAVDEALLDERYDAFLIGPGLGRDPSARERLLQVVTMGKPAVIDADALVLLDPDMVEGTDTSQLLLTPHEGELEALCGSFGIFGEGKLDKALSFSEQTGMSVLAKGPDTTLVTPDGPLLFFPPGTSWLSTAGSGDVLAGIAASRMATGLDPRVAASDAVLLHHEAARLAGPAFPADMLANRVADAYAAFL